MARLDFLIKDLPKNTAAESGKRAAVHELLDGHYSQTENPFVFLTRANENFSSPDISDLTFSPSAIHSAIWQWAGIRDAEKLRPEEILFIDTETTGLSGGTGIYAFLVGLGFIKDGRLITEQVFLTGPAGEKELVRLLEEKIRRFKVLVSFNGKSYDIPLLETRFILQSSSFPIREIPHIDLLPLSRRLWRKKLPGCSLQELEKHVLKSERDLESDIPGHLIPRYYFDYLKDGNAHPLKNIFYHNFIDIISMVQLVNLISEAMFKPDGKELSNQIYLPGIARMFYELEKHVEAERLYLHCINQKVEESEAIREFSFILKRSDRIKDATLLWEKAAAQKQTYALIELAKLAEHRDKDFDRAISLTQAALLIERENPEINLPMIQDLNHRLQRVFSRKNRQSLE